MNNTKKIISIGATLLFGVCAILLFISAVQVFDTVKSVSYADIKSYLTSTGTVNLITSITTVILVIVAAVLVACNDFENPYSKALFGVVTVLILGIVINEGISMSFIKKIYGSDVPGVATAIFVLEIFSLVLIFISLFVSNEKATYGVGIAAQLLMMVALIIAFANNGYSGLSLAFAIILFIGFFATICVCIYSITSQSYYVPRKNINYFYNTGDILYTKVQLKDGDDNLHNAGLRVRVVSRSAYNTYVVESVNLPNTVVLYDVSYSSLSRLAPSSVGNISSVSTSSMPIKEAPKKEASPEEKLKKLKSLYDDGVITEEEYNEKRKKYIELL